MVRCCCNLRKNDQRTKKVTHLAKQLGHLKIEAAQKNIEFGPYNPHIMPLSIIYTGI